MATQITLDVLENTVPLLGVTLILCLIIGQVAKKLGVPKVSGFIILGIILGPGVTDFLNKDFTHNFEFFNDLALGLILFNIGGEFNSAFFKKVEKTGLYHSITSVILSFSLVSLLMFSLLALTTSMSLTPMLIISIFLGMVSIEAAPPTTLLVLKEYSAQGELTHSIKIYLAVTTIVAVTGTLLITKGLQFFSYWDSGRGLDYMLWAEAAWKILGSLFFGIILGFALSYFETFEKKVGNILFAVIATILFGQAIAYFLKVDELLITLFLGFSIANSSAVGGKIHETIKDMGSSIYALFFVLAGTHIEPAKLGASIGIIGLYYIVVRIIGINISSIVSAKFLKIKSSAITNYHGLCVLSHAGAALAIVNRIKVHEETSAQLIFNIVVSSILVFELLGPFLLKFALFKTKEIEAWKPVTDKTSKLKLNFRDIVELFTKNIKPRPKHVKTEGELAAIIHTDIIAIKADANLENIKTYLDSTNNIFPVVDDDHCFLGSLNISSIKTLLEQGENPLITAYSLIGESTFIPSNATLANAKEVFSLTQKEVLPVVNPVNRVLEGVVYQKDILVSKDLEQKLFDRG